MAELKKQIRCKFVTEQFGPPKCSIACHMVPCNGTEDMADCPFWMSRELIFDALQLVDKLIAIHKIMVTKTKENGG